MYAQSVPETHYTKRVEIVVVEVKSSWVQFELRQFAIIKYIWHSFSQNLGLERSVSRGSSKKGESLMTIKLITLDEARRANLPGFSQVGPLEYFRQQHSKGLETFAAGHSPEIGNVLPVTYRWMMEEHSMFGLNLEMSDRCADVSAKLAKYGSQFGLQFKNKLYLPMAYAQGGIQALPLIDQWLATKPLASDSRVSFDLIGFDTIGKRVVVASSKPCPIIEKMTNVFEAFVRTFDGVFISLPCSMMTMCCLYPTGIEDDVNRGHFSDLLEELQNQLTRAPMRVKVEGLFVNTLAELRM